MGTVILFVLGVISLICFNPMTTAFTYGPTPFWHKVLTILTHMISHGSLEHLLGNYLFGFPYMLYLEYRLKSTVKFLWLFFVFGLASLVAQMISNYFSFFPGMGMIGSSGAIFGIVGAALFLKKENTFATIVSRLLALFFILTQAQMTYATLIFPDGVAYAAHLGGLLSGTYFSLRHRPHRRRRKSRRSRPSRSRK